MSGMVWVALSWLKGKPNSVACLNGVIGGLAGVTPASGFINNQYSIFLGILLGVISFFGQRILKHTLRVDDALDVSIVHGLTGIVGAIFIGFAGDSSLVEGSRDGLFYGDHSPSLLWAQLAGTGLAMAWAGVWSVIIFKFIDRIWGMKVSIEEEELGLDIVEHNEYAYHNLLLRQGNVETQNDLESALTSLESPFMSESKRLLQ
jgi:Amt family ammonium transporter